MFDNKKGQVVIYGLAKVFFMVIMAIPLMAIYAPFKDNILSSTTNLWITIPVLMLPVFYFIGIGFMFVNVIRNRSMQ